MTSDIDEPLASIIGRDLLCRYGPLVSKDDLRAVLGYKTSGAFRQAVHRQTIPIPIFTIPDRKGKFALVRDVAIWLAAQRQNGQVKAP